MARRKILWVSHLVPYPPKAGVLIRSYYLLRELARHHDVYLFAINQRQLASAYFSDESVGMALALEELGSFAKIVEVVDEPYQSSSSARIQLALRSLIGLPYSVRWLYSDEIDRSIRNHIDSLQLDIIHFDTIGLASYWHDHYAIPAVLDHHNIESHMMIRRAGVERNLIKKLYYWQEGWRLAQYERRMLRKFHHHFTCSEDDRHRLLGLDPGLTVSVVPNGIALAQPRPERRPNSAAPRLLFIGGLTWYPNHDAVVLLLDAIWPTIIAAIPEARLDIIGRGPSEKIKQLVERSRNVILHGYVDDIKPFYQEASLYLCPIRDGGGTKLKVLDALAHRVPLVAHEVACEGIALISGMHALIGNSNDEIVRSALALLGNPEYAQNIADNGYALMQQVYDFKIIGEQFAQVFAELSQTEGLSTSKEVKV